MAWGVRCGPVSGYFSSRRMPVMSRLGRAERDVLDTLILAGVANNRSRALNYAIQAFARSRRDWLRQLREASDNLRVLREQAPEDEEPGPEEPKEEPGP